MRARAGRWPISFRTRTILLRRSFSRALCIRQAAGEVPEQFLTAVGGQVFNLPKPRHVENVSPQAAQEKALIQGEHLLILGASTRAAAFSALRAGLRPSCADLFSDR